MSVVVNHGFDGSVVEVCSNVRVKAGGSVGLVASPGARGGWTVLTPDEADAVARALTRAASESRVGSSGSSSGGTT